MNESDEKEKWLVDRISYEVTMELGRYWILWPFNPRKKIQETIEKALVQWEKEK